MIGKNRSHEQLFNLSENILHRTIFCIHLHMFKNDRENKS